MSFERLRLVNLRSAVRYGLHVLLLVSHRNASFYTSLVENKGRRRKLMIRDAAIVGACFTYCKACEACEAYSSASQHSRIWRIRAQVLTSVCDSQQYLDQHRKKLTIVLMKIDGISQELIGS